MNNKSSSYKRENRLSEIVTDEQIMELERSGPGIAKKSLLLHGCSQTEETLQVS